MASQELPDQDDGLPPKEFEILAQQVPVSWTWRTLRALCEQAQSAADGVAFDTVTEKGGRRIVMIVCVTNPEEIDRVEKVLGVAPEADPTRNWEQATLFETGLRTALEGGFLYESVCGEGGKRMAIAFCTAGEKGMRVVESFFPQLGTAASAETPEQSAMDAANTEADAMIARLALPEDLRGRTLHFVSFESDRDCAYFHPGRTLEQHERILAALRAKLLPYGVQFTRSVLTPAMFEEAGKHVGDPANWAGRRVFLVPSVRNPKASSAENADGPEAAA